jgi:hypothetical protein
LIHLDTKQILSTLTKIDGLMVQCSLFCIAFFLTSRRGDNNWHQEEGKQLTSRRGETTDKSTDQSTDQYQSQYQSRGENNCQNLLTNTNQNIKISKYQKALDSHF